MRIRIALVIGTLLHLAAVRAHAACPLAPDTSCRFSLGATFAYARADDPAKDKLTYGYTNGDSTTRADLGDPVGTDSYDLCVYANGALVAAMTAGAGGDCGALPCWKSKPTSVAFTDKAAAQSGLNAIKVTVAANGDAKTKASAKGKGAGLPDMLVPLPEPIVIQLRNLPGACWGAVFHGPTQVMQDASKGKVKLHLKSKILPTCTDGVLNGFETSVDCGATCHATCQEGASCTADDQCASSLCDDGVCVPPSSGCSPTCAAGAPCTADNQCASNDCSAGVCAASSGNPNGAPCTADNQCASSLCTNGVCGPPAGH